MHGHASLRRHKTMFPSYRKQRPCHDVERSTARFGTRSTPNQKLSRVPSEPPDRSRVHSDASPIVPPTGTVRVLDTLSFVPAGTW